MAYPTRGLSPWDIALKAYIDAGGLTDDALAARGLPKTGSELSASTAAVVAETAQPLGTTEALATPVPAGGVYDRTRFLFNATGRSFRRTRAALAGVGAGKRDLSILFASDSNGAGLGAGWDEGHADGFTTTDVWAQMLRDRGRQVSEGAFFPATVQGTTLDSHWTTTGAAGVAGTSSLIASFDSGATGKYQSKLGCSGWQVTFANDWPGAFYFQSDEGAVQTRGVSGAGGFDGITLSGLDPEVPHSFTVIGAPSSAYISSIEPLQTGSRVRIHNASRSGARLQEWATLTSPAYTPAALLTFPTLTVVQLGSNDIVAGRTVEQYLADMTTLVGYLRGAGSEVLLVTPTPTGRAVDLSGYYAGLYGLALTLDVPLLDIRDRLGSYAEAKDNGMFTTHVEGGVPDNAHLSTAGLREVATAIDSVVFAA